MGIKDDRILLMFALLAGATALKILHLADFHLDVDYSVTGDNQHMCHNTTNITKSRLGPFGDYMCDAPKPLVIHAIDEAKRIVTDPDLIIWTGDNVPHVDGYDWNYVMNVMNLTTSLLFSRFPNRLILPTFGNHDYAPANAFENNSILYSKMWELWKEMLGESEKERFLLGGYYKHELSNATILVLNTNLYYNANKAYVNFTNKDDPANQFTFMESELKAAQGCRKQGSAGCKPTVHIVAHIAPGVFERTPNFTWFRNPYNEKFLKLTVDYAEVIGYMFFGHHHTDTFHLIKDPSGLTVQFALMSPAVTPWFSTLEGAGANNPAFRVYDADENGIINDIVTYYINLDTLNAKGTQAPFVEEYSFKKAYNISGSINVKAMNDLVQQLKTNGEVFRTYINFNSVLWKPDMPQGRFRPAAAAKVKLKIKSQRIVWD
nr:Metallophosphoesterase domain containing protein [Haemonchus contortus]